MGVGKSTFAFTNTAITLDGGSTTINITRDNQSYSHKLSHGFGDIATLAVGTTSYTWKPTAAQLTKFFAEIPNQKTRLIDIYLDTYNGSTLVGRDVHALTVTLSEATGKATLSGFAINDSNTTTKGLGVIVDGISTLSTTKTVTAKYGANVTKAVFMYGSNEFMNIDDLIGSLPLTATPKNYTIGYKVIDSRGFVTTASLTKSVAKYEAPMIDNLEMVRCDSSGNETEAGTKVKAIVKGSWASLGGKNTATLKLGYKLQNGTSYTYQSITVTNGVVNVEQILSATLTADSDYLFAVELKDSFTTFSEEGIGFSNSKNIMYVSADGEELIIGSSSDGNVLIGPDHIDIRKSERVLASFSAETKEEPALWDNSALVDRNYALITGDDCVNIKTDKNIEQDSVFGGSIETDSSIEEISNYHEPTTGASYSAYESAVRLRASSTAIKDGSEENLGREASIDIVSTGHMRGAGESHKSWVEIDADDVAINAANDVGDSGNIYVSGRRIQLTADDSLTYNIPVVNANCDDLCVYGGRYYLGTESTNRPVNKNGWLEVKPYSGDTGQDSMYCHQVYVTYTGEIYKRTMSAGVWSNWVGGLTNRHLLWTGTLGKGGSVTISDLPNYNTFMARTSHGITIMIGMRNMNSNGSQTKDVGFTGGYDDGTKSYWYRCTATAEGTKFTNRCCSYTQIGSSTNGGSGVLNIVALWGVM